MTARHASRKGILLIELLSVLVLSSIVMGLMWSLVHRIILINAASALTVNCLLAQDDLMDQVRNDLANAVSLPETFDKSRSDEHHLFIRQEQAVVRYRYNDFHVTRSVKRSEQPTEDSDLQSWSLPKTTVAFRVGRVLRDRDALTIEVATAVKVRHARSVTRRTIYELLLP